MRKGKCGQQHTSLAIEMNRLSYKTLLTVVFFWKTQNHKISRKFSNLEQSKFWFTNHRIIRASLFMKKVFLYLTKIYPCTIWKWLIKLITMKFQTNKNIYSKSYDEKIIDYLKFNVIFYKHFTKIHQILY